MTALLCALSLICLAGYTLITGFHDAANGTAIAVKTRALTTKVALSSSALFNLLGMLIAGTILALTSNHWLTVPHTSTGLGIIFTALATANIWGLITWWFRMPSSSTHALIGGLAGSAWAASTTGLGHHNPFSDSLLSFIVIPLLLAPFLIFALSWALVFPFYRLLQRVYPATVNRASRNILSLANSLVSLIHGIQTGQRTIVILTVLALCAGASTTPHPLLLALPLALLLAIGTARGSARIGYTFAHQMIRIDPLRGAISQSTSALALVLLQFFLNTPVSSSHLTASAALGAGVNQRYDAIRPKIVLRIILTWVLTLPLSFLLSAALLATISPLLTP